MRSDDKPQQTLGREFAPGGTPDRRDYFMERDGERFAGLHVIVDLERASRLNDIGHIEATLRACVDAAGATLLHIHLHHFGPGGGVSGVAVLAESHMSIHTWPEADFAAVDIFMCGDTRPERVVPVLQEAFATTRTQVQHIRRGRGV